MKVRTGFVSNSSSSSFVVLGFSFKDGFLEDVEDHEEILEELEEDLAVLRGADDGVPNGDTILGVRLYDIDGCGEMASVSYSLHNITEKLVELRAKIKNSLELEDDEFGEPAIFGGTRCC